MVTSDFRLEVEIRPFRACAMKNNPYLWPNRQISRLSGNRGRGTPSGVRDINLPEAIQFCSQMRCACTIDRSPMKLLL